MASLVASVEVESPAVAIDVGEPVLLAPTSRQLPVLQPSPIPPEWVLAGKPLARALELTPGGKGQCTSGLWACSAGRFNWHFASDEIVRILNGEVHLRFDDREQTARAGDVVAFRGGSIVEWNVPEYIEKFWVLGPPPTLATRLRRKLKRAG